MVSLISVPEIKELLKLPVDSSHKDPEEAHDHWARRRKLFKESRNRSSAGGSSITSNITDESGMSALALQRPQECKVI